MASPKRPMLFLDVDGTLCPDFTQTSELLNTWPTWKRVLHPNMWPNLAPVWFSPEMIHELEMLPVDLMFLSTWQDRVDTWGLQAALGWEIPYLQFEPTANPDPTRQKKLELYRWHESTHRPFIDVDDDFHLHYEMEEWTEEIDTPHLLLKPDSMVGITPQHIKQIREFCQRVERGKVAHPKPEAKRRRESREISHDPQLWQELYLAVRHVSEGDEPLEGAKTLAPFLAQRRLEEAADAVLGSQEPVLYSWFIEEVARREPEVDLESVVWNLEIWRVINAVERRANTRSTAPLLWPDEDDHSEIQP